MPSGAGSTASNKRKRDDSYSISTVVTFHAPKKTFARVFKDSSLDETKDLVRSKLHLSHDVPLRLILVDFDTLVELDDDEDYDAFAALARYRNLHVIVNVDGEMRTKIPRTAGFLPDDWQELVSVSPSDPEKKRRKESRHDDERTTQETSPPLTRSSVPPNGPIPAQPRETTRSDGRTEPVVTGYSSDRSKSRQSFFTQTEEQPVAGPSRTTQSQASSAPSQDEARPFRGEDVLTRISGRARKTTPSSARIDEMPHSLDLDSIAPEEPLPLVKKTPKQKLVKDGGAPTSGSAAFTGASSESTESRKGKEKRKADIPTQTSHTQALIPLRSSFDSPDDIGIVARKVNTEVVAVEETRRKKKRKSSTPEADAGEATARSSQGTVPGREQRAKRIRFEVPPAEPREFLKTPVEASVAEKPKKKGQKKQGSKESTPALEEPAAPQHLPAIVVSLPQYKAEPKVEASKRPERQTKTVKAQKNATATSSSGIALTALSQGTEPITKTKTKEDASRGQNLYKTLIEPIFRSKGIDTFTSTTAVTSSQVALSSNSGARASSTQEAPSPALSDPVVKAKYAPAKPAAKETPAESTPAATAKEAPVRLPAARKKAGKSRLSQTWGPEDFEAESEPATPPATLAPAAVTPPLPALAATETNAKGKKAQKQKETQCLVCRSSPFHLRFQCPVILAGAESIQKRLQEMMASGTDDALVKEMHEHLEKAKQKERTGTERKVPVEEPARPAPASNPPSSPPPPEEVSRPFSPEIPFPSSPVIPAGSEIDEVPVEGKDEGSSADSDSSDEEEDKPNPYEFPETLSAAALPPLSSQVEIGEISLEALLRGPARPKSILAQLDAESSSSESDSEPARLASEVEEREERAYRRLSKRLERDAPSSDEESAGYQDADDAGSPELSDDNESADAQALPATSDDVPINSASPAVSEELQEVEDAIKVANDSAEQAELAVGDAEMAVAQKDVPVHHALVAEPEDEQLDGAEREDVDLKDRVRAPPAGPSSLRSEDPADPVEQFDDLVPPSSFKSQGTTDPDPIEDAEGETKTGTASPPLPVSTPPTSKKMKDRLGRVPAPEALPVRAAEDSLSSQERKQQAHAEAEALFQQNGVEASISAALVPAKPRSKATQKTSVTSTSAATAISTDVAPKRRGRPPLSEAEKAKRAAERQAEKDKKAAIKQEKDRKATAKKAEKDKRDRMRAEKAKDKKGAKAQAVREASTERPESAADSMQVEDILAASTTSASTPSTSVVTVVPRRPQNITVIPETPVVRPLDEDHEKRVKQSLEKWTILSPTIETRDGESMVDELRSSSPERGVAPEAAENENATMATNEGGPSSEDETIFSNRTQWKGLRQSRRHLDPDASPTQQTSRGRVKLATTSRPQLHNHAGLSSPSPSPEASDPESEEEEPVLVKTQLRPATHWGVNSHYQRLTDIASQRLFTPLPSLNQPTPQQSAEERNRSVLSALGEDDEEEDDSTSSDNSLEDRGRKLIPRDRRAGVRSRRNSAF